MSGIERLYRVIHTRHRAKLSLIDRLKVLFGFKIDISLCVAIGVNLEDNAYKSLEVCGVESNIEVWDYNEPQTVEARTLNINFHNLPKGIITDKGV